jgi:hypothetical protein
MLSYFCNVLLKTKAAKQINSNKNSYKNVFLCLYLANEDMQRLYVYQPISIYVGHLSSFINKGM